MEVEFLVKIIANDGSERNFDGKNIEDDLKKVGLPERVAKEVAERVEERMADGWTAAQVRQETDIELRRLEEDIDRAHSAYKSTTPMGAYNVGENRSMRESDNSSSVQPRSESKVELRNVES
jgi:hypothetical protein